MKNFDKFAIVVALLLAALLIAMFASPTAKANDTVCMNVNVIVSIHTTYPQYWDENGLTCKPRTAEKGTMCLLRGWSTHYYYNRKRKSTIIMGAQRPVGQISVVENVCMKRERW